jgi:hypothetical protein
VTVKLPVLLLAIIAMLAGCSTPPRQPKDTGFLTKHVTTSLPVTKTYENLRQGFRYCDSANIGSLDCKQPGKDGAVFCNVQTNHTAGRANTLMGTMELSPAPTGTKAVLKIQTRVANSEDVLMMWEILMSGKEREVCP